MSVFAVLVSATAAVASTAVMRFAWFTALGKLALEIVQAHCVCMCGGEICVIVSKKEEKPSCNRKMSIGNESNR